MKFNQKYVKLSYIIIRMAIVTAVLAYAGGYYFAILKSPIYCVLIAFILCSGIYGIQNSPYCKKIYLGILVLFIGSVILIPRESLKETLKNHSYIAILFFVGFVLFWLEKRLKIRIAMVLMIVVCFLLTGMKQTEYSKLILGLGIFYIVDVMVQLCQLQGNKKENEKISTIFLLPVILLLIGICILIPVKQKPISWEFVKQHINDINEKIKDFIYEQYTKEAEIIDEFSVATTGYSDNSKSGLGGSIFNNDTIVLRLELGNTLYNRIYLTGTICDHYTGQGWEITQSRESNIPEYQAAFFERLYALYQGGLLDFNDNSIYHLQHLEIKMERIKTNSIFYPQNCYYINTTAKDFLKEEAGDNLVWNKSARKGTEYYTIFLEMNTSNEQLQDYIKKAGTRDITGKTYSAIDQLEEFKLFLEENNTTMVKESMYQILDTPNFAQEMEARKADITSRYLQLPEELPERVRELSWELTRDKKSDYDKVTALQEYLKSIPYKTDIVKASSDKDAVDAFLFERREGYCTYFASALAVMSRCVGIPSRYVEGVSIKGNQEAGSTIKVKATATHAWTEVYLEGYGWTLMEATSRYDEGTAINRLKWETKPMEVSVNGMEKPQTNDTDPIKAEEAPETIMENSEVKYILFALVLLILTSGLVLGNFYLQKWLKKQEYKKAGGRDKVLLTMQSIFRYLKYLNYAMHEGETLSNFRIRIEKENDLQDTNIGTILKVFEVLRYSDKEPTEKEVIQFEATMAVLKEIAIHKRGRLRFMILA